MFEFKLLFLWRGLGGVSFIDAKEGCTLMGLVRWVGGMTQPPTYPHHSPLTPPLTYATSEKGMLSELCIKKPKGVQFAGRRKVFCRQMFAAFLLHRDRVRLETPQN